MGLKWYVVRTQPRAEFLATRELRADGFEIFSPRIKDSHSGMGHSLVPLFPGYLFVRCDPEREGWPLFRQTHRILGWVGFGGEVPELPDDLVAEIKQRTEAINLEGGLRPRFRPGEAVQIVSNGLSSLAEVVEDAKSFQARVKVRLMFMRRLVSAQVPWADLQTVAHGLSEKPQVPRRTRGKGRRIRISGVRSTVTS